MLAPWKKSYDKPRQHIKKQRHYYANKGPSSQSYSFSSIHVWMWELYHKAEHQRIDASELWCWRRLLRVPWTSRRSTQSILKEISPGCLSFIGRTDAKAETPILWPPHVKSLLIGKTLMLGGIGGRRRRDDRGWDGWMASPTLWTWVWVNSWSWWLTGRPGVLRFMGSQRIVHDWAPELNITFLKSVK